MSFSPLPSLAIFCPQSKAPEEKFLSQLHSYLKNYDTLKPFLQAVMDLPRTWAMFADARTDIAEMERGPTSIQALSHWIACGDPSFLLNDTSGILSLPLLVIYQIGQYFQYLELRAISHSEVLGHLAAGGVHGYCGGFFPATAVACSSNEEEVVANASKALRIALGVGAFSELGGDDFRYGSTTMVARLKYEGQGDEIIKMFPSVYISAITDPKTISLVGPAPTLTRVQAWADGEGIRAQALHLQGKVHNPENSDFAAELCGICDKHEELLLPNVSSLRVPFRSNTTGKLIESGSLTHEVIHTVLVSTCNWYQLLTEVSSDLQLTGRKSHLAAGFGLGDVLSLVPFRQAGLQITKLDVALLIKESPPQSSIRSASYVYPPDAIAVVGMSGRFPGADNVEELWDLLAANKSRVQEVPQERVDIFGSLRASQDPKWVSKRRFWGNFLDDVSSFDHAFFGLSTREADSMDPQQRILLEAAYQAMDSSGYLYSHKRSFGDAVGVFLGASFVEYLDNTGARPPTSYTSVGTLRAFLSGRISHFFGWTGPSEVLDTACSSSLVAVHRACKAIQGGECAMALAGGVNVMASAQPFFDLGKANFLSPTGQCQPFDQGADGYCRGEGVGLVVLKRLDQAIASGDQVLGVIPGSGTNQSGLSLGLTVPHSPAILQLHQSLLKQANIRPDQVSYVEAHGTGTKVGDPLEMASIREGFGGSERENVLHVGSVKGNLGHLEAAAGVTGLIKTILMVNKGAIPPQTSHKTLNPKISSLEADKMAISSSLLQWQVPFRVACVNSYGAAGSNSALLLCEGPQRCGDAKVQSRDLTYPIIITAPSQQSLLTYALCLKNYLKGAPAGVAIGDVAFTLAEKRKHHQLRWIATASNFDCLVRYLDRGIEGKARNQSKKVVLVFSGQSQPLVGLEREFYDNFPLFRGHLDQCNEILLRQGLPAIVPAVFQTEEVSDIVVLQCGIFAVQYSSAKSWIDSGLHVDAVVGHSLGELAAMAVSGVLSLENALKLVATRASLITSKWGPDRGTMLIIQATSETVQDILSNSDAEIACFNTPQSQVVAGTEAAIASIESLMSKEATFSGIKCKRLDVTHAFHSRLTEGFLDDLDEAAASLQFNAPTIPLESSTVQEIDQVTSARVRQHTREPVAFLHAIRRIEQRLGSCVWLEAGVDSTVTSITKGAVEKLDHVFQAVKVKGKPSPTWALSSVTADLWREGISVSYWNFGSTQNTGLEQTWLPPYQFQKVRHWLPYVDNAMVDDNAPKPEAPIILPKLAKLVHPRNATGEYTIDIKTKRYQILVTGHAVLQRSLCPASLYMEFGVMAVADILGDLERQALWFKGLNFLSALGVPTDRDISLTLTRDKERMQWSFLVRSATHNDPKRKLTTHGKGEFGFTENPQFQDFQRLVTHRINQFSKSPSVETLRRKRVYELFSRVVHYSNAMQGISSITLGEYEALAEIDVPTEAETGESTVTKMCDAVALDTFIQVVGVLINSSDKCAKNEAYLTTGIASVFISSTCDFEHRKSWTVYAMFAIENEESATGDVYVLTRDGTLILSLMGVHFAKMSLSKLERVLDSGNPKPSAPKIAPAVTWREDSLLAASSDSGLSINTDSARNCTADTTWPEKEPNTFECASKIKTLKSLLSSYFGLPVEQIQGNAKIGELGLDSLAAIELASDISTKYGNDLEGVDVLGKTVDQLYEVVFGAKKMVSAPVIKSQPVKFSVQNTFFKPPIQNKQKVLKLISDVSGAPTTEITDTMALKDAGMDSLSLIELKTNVEDAFSVEIADDDFRMDSTIPDILRILSPNDFSTATDVSTDCSSLAEEPTIVASKGVPSKKIGEERSTLTGDHLETLAQCDYTFSSSARKCGFMDYWSKVAPKQDDLMLAYIAEAMLKLGVDLWKEKAGDVLPTFKHLSRHTKVVRRLWDILTRLGITEQKESDIIRTSKPISTLSSSAIFGQILEEFPEYGMDHRLMNATGSKVAECLTGKADATKILFGSLKSQQLLVDFYQNSPMFATLTDHLLTYMRRLANGEDKGVIKVLEIGAGFGGTTVRVAQMLETSGERFQYTFTDVSPMLVKNARKKLSQYSWMDFQILDLETDTPKSLRGKYDLVLATNVVHATSNLVNSMRHMKELLRDGGLIVMSEITLLIDWYELVFGLLEGWWLAKDGRQHPLQTADAWCEDLKKAGFKSARASNDGSRESVSQQLIVGSTLESQAKPIRKSLDFILPQNSFLETVTYKVVDDTEISADIYYPKTFQSPKPMPVALMFHGGGYITLSKKAVRPAQTLHLLKHGILPISFDYRLCPEINLIDGPITDTRDALVWAQTQLPAIARNRGIKVDTDRIVVIGWSTGGHLAMTTAWTAQEAGFKQPRAILTFYGQSDFDSTEFMDIDQLNDIPDRIMPLEEIRKKLSPKPITSYENTTVDKSGLGWVRPGDPRSELVLSFFKERHALNILFNGLNSPDWDQVPSASLVASVSPRAQLLSGNYSTPTFIVHGERDELLPVSMSINFAADLRAKNIKSGILVVPGAPHMHDVNLRPGDKKWAEGVLPGYDFLFEMLK